MLVTSNNANDLFLRLTDLVYSNGNDVSPRNILTKEVLAPRVELVNPLNRYFGFKERPFDLWYAFGEFFWYMSRTNKLDFISYYAPSYKDFSDDGETVNSAYGYLLFEKFGDQIEKCVDLITEDNNTRHAIAFLREPSDLYKKTKDSVCTNTLHFQLRDNMLHLIVSMRSNDLMVGFMFDSFCFTMIQEIIAYKLTVPLGSYIHISNSMHIYDKWFDVVESLGNESPDYFSLGPMTFKNRPSEVDSEVRFLCGLEKSIREANKIDLLERGVESIINDNLVTDYWKQIMLLLFAKKVLMFEGQQLFETILSELSKFQNYYFIEYLYLKLKKKIEKGVSNA